MCQNAKMWQKTDKNLTKNCQKQKSLQKLSKILLNYSKNVTKFQNVFKNCQNQFQKSDKNLTKQTVLTVFGHIFVHKNETLFRLG